MPLYTEGVSARQNIAPGELSSDFSEYAGNVVGHWWDESLSPVLLDSARLATLQAGDFLSDYVGRATHLPLFGGGMVSPEVARERTKAAGVHVDIPADGIGTTALDFLIERQQEQQKRADLMARPHSTAAAFSGNVGGFLSNVADPLNVLATFVPVVGEERYAALLAKTSTMLGRAGVRAGRGAAQGLVGTAVAEPFRYAAERYLGSDYTLADSLQNVALGGLFGAGLHVSGGAFRDALYPGWYRRAVTGEPGPQPLRAATPDAGDVELRAATGKLSDAELEAASSHAEVKAWMTQATGEALPGFRAASAETRALRQLAPGLKAELESEIGNRAESGQVPAAKQELADIGFKLQEQQDQQTFKDAAKAQQEQGLSRKQAESAARKGITARTAELQDRQAELQDLVQRNAKASQAMEDSARIDRGEVPKRFRERVQRQAASSSLTARVADLYNLPTHGSAAHLIANASPETRAAAFKAFALQMIGGHEPDVEAIVKADPQVQRILAQSGRDTSVPGALETAQRVAASDRLGSPAEAAATEGTADPAKAAAEMLDAEVQRLTGKLAARADGEKTAEALKPFDDMIAKAESNAAGYKTAAMCGGAR